MHSRDSNNILKNSSVISPISSVIKALSSRDKCTFFLYAFFGVCEHLIIYFLRYLELIVVKYM